MRETWPFSSLAHANAARAVPRSRIPRRIAADSRKIELGGDVGSKLKTDLLQAMGFDLASIHAAGSAGIGVLQHDLKTRPRNRLHDAAKTAAAAVEKDYEGWMSR
jgi:hypothetical protein